MLVFFVPLATVVILFLMEECWGVNQDPHEL